MKRMPPEELQRARVAARARFLEVGELLAHEAGVKTIRVTPHNKLSGKAWVELRRIEAPEPTTRKRLYVFAHECGHVALRHTVFQASHVKELEAEKWAHDALRRYGVPVPRSMTRSAKRYVHRVIERAVKNGAKKIDRKAAKYANYKLR